MSEIRGPLLDTTILSDVLKRKEPVATRFDEASLRAPPSMSVLSWYEVERGLRHARAVGQRRAFLRITREVRMLPVDREVADRAADLWVDQALLGRPIGELDTLIAATALAHGLPLATRDLDFAAVRGLTVLRWDL